MCTADVGPKGCIYATDLGPEGCMHAAGVCLMLGRNSLLGGCMYATGVCPMPCRNPVLGGCIYTARVLAETGADRPGHVDSYPNSAGANGVRVGEADVNAGGDEGKIVKALTRAGVGDVEEILIGALPSRVENADNVVASRGPEGFVG